MACFVISYSFKNISLGKNTLSHLWQSVNKVVNIQIGNEQNCRICSLLLFCQCAQYEKCDSITI